MSKKYTRGQRLVNLCQNNPKSSTTIEEINNVDISLKPCQSTLVEKKVVNVVPYKSQPVQQTENLLTLPDLICHEKLNLSDSGTDHYDSDDSVKDKDYIPLSSECSSCSDTEEKGHQTCPTGNNNFSMPTQDNSVYCSTPKLSETSSEDFIEDSFVDVENIEEPEHRINQEKQLERSTEIENKEKNDISEQKYGDQKILKNNKCTQKQNNTKENVRQTTLTQEKNLCEHSQIVYETNYFPDYETERITATIRKEVDHIQGVKSLKSLCLEAVNNIKEISEHINKNYADDGSEEVVVFIIIEESDMEKDEGLPQEEINVDMDAEEIGEHDNSEQPQVMNQEPPQGTPKKVDRPTDVIEEPRENDNSEKENIGPQLTKDGQIRKRKKYELSLCERKRIKENEVKERYCVKEGCSDKCILKCKNFVTEEERDNMNKKFWSLTWKERKLFIKQNTIVAIPKRKITSEPKRSPRRHFYLINSNKVKFRVCKVFFLTTLGFKSNNDSVLYNALHDEDFHDDLRGKHQKTAPINKNSINAHIESFHPSISHYRREHAPNRKYLPSDITIKFMYDDYKKKHPNMEFSYEIYRKQVKYLNISFACLGHEECESCEIHKIHSKNHGHGSDYNPEDASNICQPCEDYKKHKMRSDKARALYKNHSKINDKDHIYFSTDLEKIIMLPRLDTFKEVVFCPRLVAYNQTFAPVGEKKKKNTFAVLWHEAVSGRKQEDIISAFKMFLTEYRDVAFIHIWLDNCAAQNKNWLLYFFLINFINSDESGTKEITLYYFEKGHTFMSCDSFHHQVELSMKRSGKLYDFKDFVEAVSAANSGNVAVKEMTITDFIKVEDFTSSRRITNSTPRVYMKDIVQATFKRGNLNLFYKIDFDDNMNELCFLKDTYLKPKNGPVTVITTKTIPRGIKESRKRNILNKLGNLMPPHKKYFWENISTNNDD